MSELLFRRILPNLADPLKFNLQDTGPHVEPDSRRQTGVQAYRNLD
jgi:hypothetical protein